MLYILTPPHKRVIWVKNVDARHVFLIPNTEYSTLNEE